MIAYEDLKQLNAPFTAQFSTQFNKVIEKGHYILGEEVAAFEKEFAAYNSIPYCVGVANGLEAITLSLKALDLPADSEVIVPANTFIATVLSVLHCNLKVVLVEPRIDTYTIDPSKIEAAITPDTKAIIVVHLYGKCCDMDQIMSIKNKHNLYLIEDSAQAHGATFKGKMAGTFGDFGAFSFYPTKNLGALGDGGAIIFSDEAHQSKLLQLRNYGSDKKYYNEIIGYNCRLDEMQAAFLRVKLPYLNEIIAHKNKLADIYLKSLNDNFVLPVKHADYHDVYHIFNIRHPRRDELKDYLEAHVIQTAIHYPVPPHKQNAMKHIFEGQNFPVSEEIHATTLSLPCSYFHTTEDVEYIVDVMNKFN
ncbi:DegT/DnrJ/EryC1/StrS aminotransferase family protein [Pedobacter sp. L105]|uniref:DegT/DnrJ/EryC1/StrS family aminotransferase n=1 Tax=Pedobacter sp. L105 TaxID=1641871 RepID=UPI00131C479B|nr:DegT/DnrJ/EryC1/StrS family aminotransferase [Pedobacter sp. L105]